MRIRIVSGPLGGEKQVAPEDAVGGPINRFEAHSISNVAQVAQQLPALE